MSDRSQFLQADITGSASSLDLSELRASKEDSLTNQTTAPDLSQASISNANIHRSTQRLESRTLQSLRPTRSVTTLRAEIARRSKTDTAPSTRKRPNGIVVNPYYRYRGGPLARLITLLANILKVAQQMLLKVLQPSPITTKATIPSSSAPSTQAHAAAEKQRLDEKQKLEKARNLSTHRR